MQAVLVFSKIEGQSFRMKNIDHPCIASYSAVRSLHSLIDYRPIRVPDVVVSLQDAMDRRLRYAIFWRFGRLYDLMFSSR